MAFIRVSAVPIAPDSTRFTTTAFAPVTRAVLISSVWVCWFALESLSTTVRPLASIAASSAVRTLERYTSPNVYQDT